MGDQTSEALQLLADVQRAIGAGDMDALRHSSDALRGLMTALLANRAFETAARLEKTLNEEDLEQALDACRRLRETLAALHPAGAKIGAIDTPK